MQTIMIWAQLVRAERSSFSSARSAKAPRPCKFRPKALPIFFCQDALVSVENDAGEKKEQ